MISRRYDGFRLRLIMGAFFHKPFFIKGGFNMTQKGGFNMTQVTMLSASQISHLLDTPAVIDAEADA